MSQEKEEQSYVEWLRKHDPQGAQWLERCLEVDAEVAAMDAETLQLKFNALVDEVRQQGKIILEADKDWELIYELNKQTHSMQAPFCDTSGLGMKHVPERYVVLNNADLRGRFKELMVEFEYPKYHTQVENR